MRLLVYSRRGFRECIRPTQRPMAVWGALFFPLLLLGSHAGAQTLTTLGSFNGSDGASPNCGLAISGNTLYGTATGGSLGVGVVFSLPVSGGAPTALVTFTGNKGGFQPEAGLTLSGGILYGTTEYGGEVPTNGGNGLGEVFSLPVSGGTQTVLATFNGSIGANPSAVLTPSGSTLYGTTSWGGPGGDGVVFSVPVTGGTPTVLAAFNGSNGELPNALTLSGSTLYGTTNAGGLGLGTVFSVPVTGGSLSVLGMFSNGNGEYPNGSLTLSGSTLYGTTDSGGGNDDGVVFSIPVSGGTPKVLASFNGNGGSFPTGSLTIVGDTLYGVAMEGGADGGGEVFSVPLSGGSPTALVTFNGTNGSGPVDMMLNGNTFYGATGGGGANGQGTVFSLTLPNLPFTSQWANPVSGNWSDSSKWSNDPPSSDGAVAVINVSTTAALTVTLDAPQTVGTLTLGSGNAGVGYTLSGSNSLTFSNSSNSAAASISVIDGTHFINAPVVLTSDLVVTSTSSTPWQLTFAAASSIMDKGNHLSLTMSASNGTLILSGSDNYAGGTFVEAGTLIVTNPSAILAGTDLTVGNASSFPNNAPAIRSSAVSPVPEPGTLALVVVGACGLLGCAWRRRKRA